MRKAFFITALLLNVLYFSLEGSTSFKNLKNGNAALLMQGINQSELDDQIIGYYKVNIVDSTTKLSPEMIRTTIVDINNDGKKDVIAILESRESCGSGGCIASIFIADKFGALEAIPFGYAIKEITVLDSVTQGMHDLRINDAGQLMIWNGSTYELNKI